MKNDACRINLPPILSPRPALWLGRTSLNLDNVQVQLVVLNQTKLLHDLEEEDRDHGRHNDSPQHVGNELAGALAPEVDRG